MDSLMMARRTCAKCGKEFLIENDVPKKPSESVRPTKKSARLKSRPS